MAKRTKHETSLPIRLPLYICVYVDLSIGSMDDEACLIRKVVLKQKTLFNDKLAWTEA